MNNSSVNEILDSLNSNRVNESQEEIAEDVVVGMHRLRYCMGRYYMSSNGGSTWKEISRREYDKRLNELNSKLEVLRGA